MKIGKPITPEEIAQLDDDQLLATLQERMHTMFQEVRYSRSRSMNPRMHTADQTQFA